MTDPAMTLDGFHPEFAELAERIAGQRIGAYARSFSKHRIFAMQAIAEIWRAAADNLTPRQCCMALTQAQALEELALTIETATTRLRKRPADRERQRQLEQLIAMRWWHAFFPEPPPVRTDGRADYRPAPVGRVYPLQMALTLRAEAMTRMLAHQADRERNAA